MSNQPWTFLEDDTEMPTNKLGRYDIAVYQKSFAKIVRAIPLNSLLTWNARPGEGVMYAFREHVIEEAPTVPAWALEQSEQEDNAE